MPLAYDPLIRLQGITKIFHADEVETHALSRIDLEIRAGEYVAVCGPDAAARAERKLSDPLLAPLRQLRGLK